MRQNHYLSIRECQLMGLTVQTTNKLSVHKNLENINSRSDRINYNHFETILFVYSKCF